MFAGTALLSLPVLVCLPDVAVSQTRSFDIPAQPLASALRRFADQSGMQLAYRTADLRGLTSPGYRGPGDNATILARLLAGSGASYRLTSANTATIARPAPGAAAAPAGAIALDTIEVQGANPTATLGPPPAPYAGGQVGSGARLGILGNLNTFSTPFSITGYTDKLIKDQQARSIADVVLNDPSVQLGLPRYGLQDQFVIRGFRTFQQDILFDGVGGVVDTRRPAIDNVERVEILKGPSTLLYNTTINGVFSGIINYVPKRAPDEPLNRVTFGYASKAEFGASADVARRFGADKEWGIRINTTLRDGNVSVDDTKTGYGFGSIGLDYRGDRLRASLDAGYQTQSHDSFQALATIGPNVTAMPRAPKASLNQNPPWSFEDTRHAFMAARAEFDATDWLTVYGTFGASRFQSTRFTTGYQILSNAGARGGAQALDLFDTQSFGFDVGAKAKFATGPIDHLLTVSIAGNSRLGDYTDTAIVGSAISTTIYNPVFPASANRLSVPDEPLTRSSRNITNSVAFSNVMTALNERIVVAAGGRLQTIKAKAFDQVLGSRTFGQATSFYDEQAFSPAVGVAVKPLEKLTLYGNYVEGLQGGSSAPVTAANRGQTLAPFVQKQYELGAKYDFGAFGVTGAYFNIERQSAFTDPVTNIFAANGLQRNSGVELTVFGEPVEGLRVIGGVAFIEGTLVNTASGALDGKTPAGVPDMQASVYVEYDLPRSFLPGLTVTGRVLYSDAQFVNQQNTVTIPEWTRVDLGLRYTLEGWNKKPIVLRATVENVFDRNYWQTAIDGLVSQGAPRTFLVSAQFDF